MNHRTYRIGLLLLLAPLIAPPSSAVGEDNSEATIPSGDPRGLTLDDVREIRNYVASISVAVSDKPGAMRRVPLRGEYRVSYGVPKGFDEFMAIRDADVYAELGLRAWAVDFEGGPLGLWYSLESEDKVDRVGGFWGDTGAYISCDAKKGHLIWWCLPSSSDKHSNERSAQIMKLLRAKIPGPDDIAGIAGIPYYQAIQLVGGECLEFFTNQPWQGPPLWSDWNGVKFTRHSPKTVKVGGPTPLLDIEAVEAKPRRDSRPRKLRLRIMAKPLPVK